MNKKIFLQWVNKIFIPTVIKIRKKQNLDENERALLILDGHSSRINFPALVLMRINCVDVVIIPSHSSHILQPLDVGVFHIFKSNLRKAKLNQDDNPFLTIDECLIQSTTKKKIIGAFKKCGLFPLDLSKVINHPGIFPTEVQKIYGRVNTGRRLHLGGKLISSKEMIKQMKEKFERQMKKKT
ncbi:tigger transposable element-derived protein [Anaeramoeba flamelloides]|uniref:Tigger transposable element-derived protein n=1 Tax=Anaeramoeba flamelloides TaxID=1746091 RepID=A0ABQ8YFG6_9EUKA|nr:tigger transposable element-derived protein [Anaeramoeba flamelloides]